MPAGADAAPAQRGLTDGENLIDLRTRGYLNTKEGRCHVSISTVPISVQRWEQLLLRRGVAAPGGASGRGLSLIHI